MQYHLLDANEGPRGCRISLLAAALASACVAGPALAQESGSAKSVEFESGVFPGSSRIDLSRFNHGNVVLPGSYRADVQLNGRLLRSETLVFKETADGEGQLCMDTAMLERLGVNLAKMPGAEDNTSDDASCRPLEDWVPGASARFDLGAQVLEVQIAQAYLSNRPRDLVPREALDQGVTAGHLQYNANLYDTRFANSENRRAYVGIRAGLNVGGWLLRHQGSLGWDRDDEQGSRYQASSTFAQRDVDALQSQLVIGQLYTKGDLFGSVRLQGAELATDDRMLPQSATGYAPVVHGVAESNALVRVMQRGTVLREVTVAPGPFVIDDLNAIGFGGDLQVLIQEADGRERTLVIPYSGNTRLLRPGYTRFAISAGRADPLQSSYQPYVAQAQVQRGLSNAVTGFAGVLKSQHYASAQVGAAVNTAVGSLSLDLTQAKLDLSRDDLSGQSVQLRFTKQLPESGTSFTVGAYRYSTKGFVDINQALRLKAEDREGDLSRNIDRYRSRLEANLSQSLGRTGGAVYVSASRQDFWNRGGTALSYTAGYNNSWGSLGYGVSIQRSVQLATGRADDQFNVTLSMPLGESPRAPRLNATFRQDRNNQVGTNLGVSGVAGEHRELSYGFNAQRDGDSSTSLSASAHYKASQATVGGSISRGSDYRNLSLDASGALIAHANGITLSPRLGDTIALVHASGAEGARLSDGDGARIDRRGYAVRAGLTPYRFNTVEIDPRGLSEDVLLKTTTRLVAPRHGAVLSLDFPTETGRAMLVKAVRPGGQLLPFAAGVFDAQGNAVGNVGQGSRLQVLTSDDAGVLTVRWGNQPEEQCQIDYRLPPRVGKTQRSADVIDQATCYRAPWMASEQAPPSPRVSVAPPQHERQTDTGASGVSPLRALP